MRRIGSIQVNEAIKLITGIGDPPIGRLMIYDALEMEYRKLKVRKDPDCALCGENPTVTGLIDYEASAARSPRRRRGRRRLDDLRDQLEHMLKERDEGTRTSTSSTCASPTSSRSTGSPARC